MTDLDDKFAPVTREDLDSIAALRRRVDLKFEEIRTAIDTLAGLVRQSLDNHRDHSADDHDRFTDLERRVSAIETNFDDREASGSRSKAAG